MCGLGWKVISLKVWTSLSQVGGRDDEKEEYAESQERPAAILL